ncbi:MAG: mevalonate kinase [Caldilineaceae bacterium]
MQTFQGSAPGKVILLGEHAVVYGRPAIAVPVWETTATAVITDSEPRRGVTIVARDLGQEFPLVTSAGAEEHPFSRVARLTLERLHLPLNLDWRIALTSTIPIASGLGSGAALSAALVRAIFAKAGEPAEPTVVSALVYESERYFHGTPSGIDNTVIAYGAPVWFVKGAPPQIFTPCRPFTLVIADSGIASPTKETVGDVRQAWQKQPNHFEAIFDEISQIAEQARHIIEQTGHLSKLGQLFNENQCLLAALGVSSQMLEKLLAAARRAGALGAKLSGGGRGGNIIALVEDAAADEVRSALLQAGAKQVIVTRVA